MNRSPIVGVFCGLAALAALAFACGSDPSHDPTLRLTGTESSALVTTDQDGNLVYSCPAKKALVCHVPPGNPANAHTICVGVAAVSAHLRNHPDTQGPCDGGLTAEPEPEACLPLDGICSADEDCCSTMCSSGVCVSPFL
jgi:hypothetical protein